MTDHFYWFYWFMTDLNLWLIREFNKLAWKYLNQFFKFFSRNTVFCHICHTLISEFFMYQSLEENEKNIKRGVPSFLRMGKKSEKNWNKDG